jgi:electron transport complex protein RnfG
VLCSLAIVTTYQWTRPIIANNRIAQRRRAILDVVPQADSIQAFTFDEEEQSFRPVPENSDEGGLVFAGFDDSGDLVGLALAAKGMGYQDSIELLYGYDPASESVVGIRVLESRETPGLGDRIETDEVFLENFKQLDARVAEDGKSLVHEIAFVKPGEKTKAWQIDGITGATISSRAVAEMLRESTNTWLPRLQSSVDDLRLEVGGGAS